MDVNPDPSPQPYRHLSLRDLGWIVAAMALGAGGWAFQARAVARVRPSYRAMPSDFGGWVSLISMLAVALAWVLAIRSRRLPRDERREAGYLACLAVIVGTLVLYVEFFSMFIFQDRTVSFFTNLLLTYSYCFVQSRSVVAALAIAWWPSWRDGRWGQSSGATELLGRLIGFWFVATFALQCGGQFWTALQRAGSLRKLLSPEALIMLIDSISAI